MARLDQSTSKRKRSGTGSTSDSRSDRSDSRSPSPKRSNGKDKREDRDPSRSRSRSRSNSASSADPNTDESRRPKIRNHSQESDEPPRKSTSNPTNQGRELIPISNPSNGLKKNAPPAPPERTEESGAKLRAELNKLAPTRAGGAYIPPARLRALMAEAAASDPGSVEYQRMSWDALKKSLTGLINKVALENIKHIVPELFGGANLIRGRGLFCRSIMRAQSLSLSYTPVLASLTAIINTKLPMVGELLVTRLVSQFRRSFRRSDKTVCHATSLFIAHLVNQRVVTEVLALEILVLLLEKPSDDSVEIAVGFMREVGAFLSEESPKATNSIFDRFRSVLYEGSITKRVQYMIEVLTTVRRDKFKDNPRIPEELDLVEEDDQITHKIGLDDELNVQEGLNVFKPDPSFLENEEAYRQIKAEILGENSDSEASGSESGSESDSESSDDEDDEAKEQERLDIQDRTETNMVNLRRTIYLTIMSAAVFEEAVHKLLKLDIPEGKEIELCNMVIECCSQERTYAKFYGHIGERLCKLRRMWSACFEECFKNYYDTIHRYETNRLRNIARFFGTLLGTDSISWASFEMIHMNEDDTTSSSRIFVKILFQEINEILGIKELKSRFAEESMQESYRNIFPMDNPKNTRFSINYFTSIQLGALTEGMREHLKNAPKLLLEQQRLKALERANRAGSDSDSDSDSDSSDSDSSSVLSSSSDDSSSLSSSSRSRSRSRTPPRRRRRSSTYDSRSPTPPRRKRYSPTPSASRSRSRSRSPVTRRRRSPSYDSRSRSPPPHRRRRASSRDSRSPPPKRRRSLSRTPPRRSDGARERSPARDTRRRD